MSPGRLWWLIRRDWRRGWSATWNDYWLCDRLLVNPVPFGHGRAVESVPVVLLTGARDFRYAVWTLASWFHFTARNWQVNLHDDGTLTPRHERQLQSLFPNSKVCWRKDADLIMAAALAGLPAAGQYRYSHILALKSFDVPTLNQVSRLILLDSDLLFFKMPKEILSWVDSNDGSSWFNQDAKESSGVSPEEVFSRYGFRLWPKVNSGLCLLQLDAFDVISMNRWLTETPLLKGNLWIVEQTLFTMAASRAGQGGLLPPQYEVSLGPWAAGDCVMRHYVGSVRQRFFGEGITRLAPILLNRKPPSNRSPARA